MKNESFQSILAKDSNNFNFVRLLAALAVIYAHSYAITSNPGNGDLIARTTGVTHTGELSVVIFFFISGALVTKSLLSRNNITEYLIKRIFRIYPALIVCNLIVTFLIPLAFSEISASQLFKSHQALNYFFSNSLGVWNEHFIPGIYETHPNKGLNGSLWSVTLELRLYLFLALLALIGLMDNVVVRLITICGLLIVLGVNFKLVPLLGSENSLYGNYSFPAFSAIFLFGGLFHMLEKQIKLNLANALVIFFVLLLFSKNTEIYRFVIFTFTIILCLWVATREIIIKKIPIRHDYSYGTYLYGWPALQMSFTIISKNHTDNPLNITCLAMLIALTMAMLSWHFIEKPCITFAHKMAGSDGRTFAKMRMNYWLTNLRAKKS